MFSGWEKYWCGDGGRDQAGGANDVVHPVISQFGGTSLKKPSILNTGRGPGKKWKNIEFPRLFGILHICLNFLREAACEKEAAQCFDVRKSKDWKVQESTEPTVASHRN
ncbi:hypothetical protein TNCT_365891 [Trichonephila clavata]|uniref:Uncharacterized protein n=1 Tax=Trichonephila clavata TaxID=2740835 RepID=A0A8X6FMQ6_TRICU|nr:hypothetical protein TNCT_365891 [Trichonephila clavata]